MKILTLERCRDCPSYIPDYSAYYDEYGACGRDRSITVADDSKIPEGCPLKEFENEPK